jgi:hypothetical protein
MAATLIRAAEAPRFEVHGAQVVGYASPARGSASLAAWRLSLSPGVASPLHQLSGTMPIDVLLACVRSQGGARCS